MTTHDASNPAWRVRAVRDFTVIHYLGEQRHARHIPAGTEGWIYPFSTNDVSPVVNFDGEVPPYYHRHVHVVAGAVEFVNPELAAKAMNPQGAVSG